jgi:hypothetical protein
VKIVGGADQRRLLKYLFEDSKHDPYERPVLNDSRTLAVSVSLALQQIIDFVSFSCIKITVIFISTYSTG